MAASEIEIQRLWDGNMVPEILFSDHGRAAPLLNLEDYAMTVTESAASNDDGTAVAVESWMQKNGWHNIMRDKLATVGHERP